MKTLELFAGSQSFSKVLAILGHETFTSDVKQFGDISYVVDVMRFNFKKVPYVPDIIWASPPCGTFSVASISTHWKGGKRAYEPRTEASELGIKLVKKTTSIIKRYQKLNPYLIWFIENPRGVLRKLDLIKGTRYTVTYCQYGDNKMKPTDIWTNSKWTPKPMCKNGDKCHMPAPRGSKTGTQGLKGSYDRSKIPPQLFFEILKNI